MANVAEFTSQGTLVLPKEISAHFQPSDRFAVWVEGDAMHLKRLSPPAVTQVAAERPDDDPLSLDEINIIVHEVRRSHRSR